MPIGVVHLSLTELGPSEVELRSWRDNPNDYTRRTLATAEIADLAAKAEADYDALTEPDLVAIGKRLFRWLDGMERWLARELAAIAGRQVALLIQSAGRLAHLPWEVLHDGTTFLVHGADPAVLPVRWRRAALHPAVTQNRPLNVLFMATSPFGMRPELNDEEEEGRILKATQTYPLGLTVEETGNLKDLLELVKDYPEEYFDVLHLTGYADHRPEGPRFLTESATGEAEWVSAADIAEAIPRRPKLTFLSGCRTAQSLGGGAVPSLAEGLLAHGFPAVLGWGRPVLDADAIVATAALYDRLASGFTPVESVLHAHAQAQKARAKHWHQLRMFVAGGVPTALVTSPNTPGRSQAPLITHARRYLGKQLNSAGRVVDRKDFVGRRRPLQRFIRALRGQDRPAGAVIHGLGGVGKSSLACRICDRIGDAFESVVHIGVLDEPSLLRSLDLLPGTTGEQRVALQAGRDPLYLRLQAFLNLRAAAGMKKVLLVIDDFEQNTPLRDGQPVIDPEAQAVMEALVWAVEQADAARCLITSRYKLTTTQGDLFYQEELSALRPAEVDKKRRRSLADRDATPDLRERVDRVADGNPRLMEWLDRVLNQKSLVHDTLLQRMEEEENECRDTVLARELVAGLPEPTRRLLAEMLVYELPVPFAAVTALFPDRGEDKVRDGLAAAAAVGLVEEEPQLGGTVYQVPRLLGPILAADCPADPGPLVDAAASALLKLWWESDYQPTELETLEIARLGRRARRADVVAPVTAEIGQSWLNQSRYREASSLYAKAIAAIGRDYRLVGGLGQAERVLGDGGKAYELLNEALKGCPAGDEQARFGFVFAFSELLILRGELNEAPRILREKQLPAADRLQDIRSRAVTLGQIADVLAGRGELDEALRIRREEELPVYERLGDVRERAVVQGKIADVLAGRGELDEALRILRDDTLPTLRRLDEPSTLSQVLLRLGLLTLRCGQPENAMRYLGEAIVYADRAGDRQTAKSILRMVGPPEATPHA